MTPVHRAIFCAFAAFFLIAADEPPGAGVVAQRGDVHLTVAELNDTLSLLDPAVRAQVTATPQTLANFVRERLLNMAVIAEAKAKGWDSQPDVVLRMNEARNGVILQTYLTAQVPADPAFPSEADVTTTYEKNKSRLVAPKQFHIAQVVLTVKPDATPDEEEAVHKKAIELRALAVKPKADFAEIARRNSQEPPSAEKGGEVGWLREADMMPSVRETVTALAEGGVSQPIRVPDGWHILKLVEMKPASQVSLLDAKAQIVTALRQARSQRLMKAWLDEMLKVQPIEVNEIELTKQVGGGK
jgi:hypothetical protein